MASLTDIMRLMLRHVRLIAYPVGSYYCSSVSTDPHELFGVHGSRSRVGSSSPATVPMAGTTGGEETHKLIINEMPAHSHQYTRLPQSYANTDYSKDEQANFNSSVRWSSNTEHVQIKNTGGNQPHNNMPPYKSVYAWQRVK